MKPVIYIVKNEDPIPDNQFSFLLKYVQHEKRTRILRQRIKQNADNILVGDILAKVAIKQVFGIDIAIQHISYSKYRKPYLPNFLNVHFNISHSGEYVVCALSDKPVGIDIQKISEYNPAVAKRVCSAQELKHIETSTDKSSEFIKLWTQKEAVIKMYGTGIASGNIKNHLDNYNVISQNIYNYWISVYSKMP